MPFSDALARLAIVGLGMVYPGYQSFKAVKREDVPMQKAWLQYWLVLSVLSAAMLILEPLLYHRVPMYNLFKVAAVAYLVLPMTKGYKAVYDAVLLPQLDRHEAAIDDAAGKFMKAGEQHAKAIGPRVTELVNKSKGVAGQAGRRPTAPATKVQ